MNGSDAIRFPAPDDSTSAEWRLPVELDALSLYKLARRARRLSHNILPPRGEPVSSLRAQIPEAGVQVDICRSPAMDCGITQTRIQRVRVGG